MRVKIYIPLFILQLCIISFHSSAQSKDTLIIIPFGNSQLYADAVLSPIKKISGGSNFLHVLNEAGQLDTRIDDNASYMEMPVIKEKLSDIRSGDIHSLALYRDSTISQFFVHSSIQMFCPEKLRKITHIAAGPKMSLAINQKNIMYTWGPKNMVKKLQIPVKTYGVKTAALGENYVAFINIKNKVFVWGDRSSGKNNIPVFKASPLAITSGDQHIMVLDQNKNLYAWGNNLLGQCNIPTFTSKIKMIDSKKHRNLAVLENDEVYIWGMNETILLNYASLGTVKNATLGNNFVAIVVNTTQAKIDSSKRSKPFIKIDRTNLFSVADKKDTSLLLAKDSLLRSLRVATDSNFIKNYLSQLYADEPSFNFGNNNIVNILNDDSYFENIESLTQIIFEGNNNEITIINRGVRSTRKNVKQVIIIKGSGKKYTIYNNGTQENISDKSFIQEINLDETGEENFYPEEYVEKKEDLSLPIQSLDFIEFDNLPNTMISEFPISEGEYWYNSEFACKANDFACLLDQAGFWDPFEAAQVYFYCRNNAKALKTLIESEPLHYHCKLALFEIYYYGLFGIAPDRAKATLYYNKYLQGKVR